MNQIISELYGMIKNNNNLIETEESIQLYMYQVFSSLLGEIFTNINKAIKEKKQLEGWTVERNDWRTVQFVFGEVTYKRTLMKDEQGNNHYPVDEWLGVRKYQRYSPMVEVKVAELASENTYRKTAQILQEWTEVRISHQTVGKVVRQVGDAQAKADDKMVEELEEAATLPEGKKIDFLYTEADGVFVRGTEKRKSIEVRHAILYEGWNKNGKRVSLKNPKVIMTTNPTANFWKEVQALGANHYSLETTQVISNSDGGQGYTADKFQEAFSQSQYPVLNQLDSYHVYQALNRAFGVKNNTYKESVRKAINAHDLDNFKLWLDTYESTLDDAKRVKKLKEFRTYIVRNWDRIFDWRDKVNNCPSDARTLGAMESNQRHVTFRMKKRGMHWSAAGGQAMVKVKQGIQNETLRDSYLKNQHRSTRQQRKVKQVIRMSEYLHQATRPSIGAKKGSISLYTAHSTAIGQLMKSFR